jgi:hypothetical protein
MRGQQVSTILLKGGIRTEENRKMHCAGQMASLRIDEHGQICLFGEPMGERSEKVERQIERRNLLERLERHPDLKERFEMILDIVENAGGDVEKAAEAERRAIEAVRQLGNEIVQGWAQRQHQKKENECDQDGELSRKEKKRFTGSRSSEKSK